MKSKQKGGRNTPNLQINHIDFAEKEGEGVRKSKNNVDVIYGSPLMHYRHISVNLHALFNLFGVQKNDLTSDHFIPKPR